MSSERTHDVGAREVVPLEQQRLSGVAGERVRAAVAEVQAGGMTTLAVTSAEPTAVVVSENLVGGSRVEVGQRGATVRDIENRIP